MKRNLNSWKTLILLLATAPMNHAMDMSFGATSNLNDSAEMPDGSLNQEQLLNQSNIKLGETWIDGISEGKSFDVIEPNELQPDQNQMIEKQVSDPKGIEHQTKNISHEIVPENLDTSEQNMEDNTPTALSLDDIAARDFALKIESYRKKIDGTISSIPLNFVNQLDDISNKINQKTKELQENIRNGSDGFFGRGSLTNRQKAKENADQLELMIQPHIGFLMHKHHAPKMMEEIEEGMKVFIGKMESEKKEQENKLNALYKGTGFFDYAANPFQSESGKIYGTQKPIINDRIHQIDHEISRANSILKDYRRNFLSAMDRVSSAVEAAQKQLSDYKKTVLTWK